MKSETIKKLSQIAEGCEIKIEVKSANAEGMKPIVNKCSQLLDWANNPNQQSLEFATHVTFSNVKLRADKPTSGTGLWSVGLDIRDIGMDDRSHVFNLMQSGKKFYVRFVEVEETREQKMARFTTETRDLFDKKVVEPEGETPDKALWRALHSVANAAERWEARRKTGLSGVELSDAVGEEFGDSGSGGPGLLGYICSGGRKPKIWFAKDVKSQPDRKGTPLHGMPLLEKVRTLLAIPEPVPEKESKKTNGDGAELGPYAGKKRKKGAKRQPSQSEVRVD